MTSTTICAALLAVALLLLACGQYGPYRDFGGGYTDHETRRGHHFIRYQGVGIHSRAEVLAFWHQRARELCGRYEVLDLRDVRTTKEVPIAEIPGSTTCSVFGGTVHCNDRPSQTISSGSEQWDFEGTVRCVANSDGP